MKQCVLLLFPLALSATAFAQADTPTDAAIPAKYRSHRDWKIDLPGAAHVKVGAAIQLAGHTFRAERDGTGLAIDTDGDGETDVTVHGDQGFVKLRKGDFRYAVRLANRGQGWHYASSCVRQLTLGDTRIRLIDQDANGRFDDYGIDAMIVGRGDTATFLSEVVSVDDRVLRFDVARDGSVVNLRDYDGETGTLDLTSSLETKGKLTSAIVVSSNGKLSFDLARGAMRVPTGTYRIHSGQIALGDTTVAVRRGRAADLLVARDATMRLDWGGPAKAEFAYERQGDKVQFSPDAVWYYGDSGEEYANWNPVGKSPTFEVKVDGAVIATAIFPGSC